MKTKMSQSRPLHVCELFCNERSNHLNLKFDGMTDAPSNIQLCAEIVFILRQQGMRSLWQWSFEKGK